MEPAMIKFSSKATGDIQMLAAHGTQLLALIGKTDLERGVITLQQIPNAIARLSSAGRQDRESRKLADADAERKAEPGERPAPRRAE